MTQGVCRLWAQTPVLEKKKKYNVLGYTVKQVEPSSTAEDFRD
jgi:hypothetical protein